MQIKIGMAQTPNSLSLEKNFQSIEALLAQFAKAGADLVVFPECSLSGFSAKMKECTLDVLSPYLEKVKLFTLDHGITVVLPSALVENGRIYNSGWWMSQGEVQKFYKVGLTESEHKFFSVPETRSSKVFETKGFKFGILLCFEAEHAPWTYFNPGEVDSILWPGYWGWEIDSQWAAEKSPGKPNRIFENMKTWRIPLLQSNFAFNDLEGHIGAGPEGLSFMIDSDNTLVHRGPHQRQGGVVVTIEKQASREVQIVECRGLNAAT